MSLVTLSPSLYPPSTVDSKENIVILDGGLGTTLEQTFGLDISNTPLWSAKAAIEHPEVIVDAHLAFLRAGARIILTSTYQCSLSTFETAGYATPDARKIMATCVQLAAEARSRFSDERRRPESSASGEPVVKIALSSGPFGAGLAPAQERRQALARFHFERLCVFADDEAAWGSIDFIAFETVPVLREIRAIRMAMAALEDTTFVFPGGKFPETQSADEGDVEKISVRSVVAAALQNSGLEASDSLPSPSALGINCTEMDAIPNILTHMEAAVQEFHAHGTTSPLAGDIYDPVSQTWVVKDKGGVWAEQLAEIVADIRSHGGVWAGVVAGGCCRTGPDDIALLSKLHEQ
ncbi:Homocysteine S-methyltransferase [Mycena vulgaris]|nr:Homocysteine S-methyltransferase [Mycena vulgaris]